MKHKTTKLTLGEYAYRGFVIFDTGGGRSGFERMNRNSPFRWRVVRKTGPGYLDRENTRFDSSTFKSAKERIDRALAKEQGHG